MPEGLRGEESIAELCRREGIGLVLDKPVASETTFHEIDLSVRDTLATAFEEARSILTKRRADLDQGAELLLSKEVITSDDFPALQ